MVENALHSIVQIHVPLGGGTGFIVNSEGLIVTNLHVVSGMRSMGVRLASGESFIAQSAGLHPDLDLAYLKIESDSPFKPIAIGDSDNLRVGESVIVIGFPIADILGSEPTVSQGIVSARRAGGILQTDAPVNPGNSGGPMLDQFGNVVGVITSRIEGAGGRNISGVGFAIPVNEVTADLAGRVTPGEPLPTPLPTPRPTLPPPIDLDATKAALAEEDAFLQTKEAAKYQAEKDRLEAQRFAASLEATRLANRPTPTPVPTPTLVPTPTPEPTPTSSPTPTPHPQVYCEEWEAMVQDWVREGNNYYTYSNYKTQRNALIPDHPLLSAKEAHGFCIIAFPIGRLYEHDAADGSSAKGRHVGTERGQLLPGVYQYRAREGGDRVRSHDCFLELNKGTDEGSRVDLTYGEPFRFTFFVYHGIVNLGRYCYGHLYRVGD